MKAAGLAGCGAFMAGAAVGWLVLNQMPTLVTVTDQRVVLTLVGGLFVLTAIAGTAGYATARWWHARSIPSRGRVRATAVGTLVALVAAGGVVASVQPWCFPSAHVLVVSPLAAGEFLAQHQVVGGLVVSSNDAPVAYLRTAMGTWIEAAISRSAVMAVDQAIPAASGYTPESIAREVGDGQQGALRTGTEWLWLVVGVMGAWAAALAVVQRRRWRQAPWPAPVASDTLRAMARAYSGLG